MRYNIISISYKVAVAYLVDAVAFAHGAFCVYDRELFWTEERSKSGDVSDESKQDNTKISSDNDLGINHCVSGLW